MDKPSIALRHPSPGARLTLSINVDTTTPPEPRQLDPSLPLPTSLSIHGAAVSVGAKGTLGPSTCLPSEASRSRGALSPSCSKLDFSRITTGALSISSAPATTTLRPTGSYASLGHPKGQGQGQGPSPEAIATGFLSLPSKGQAQTASSPQHDRRGRHRNEHSFSFQAPPSASRRRSVSSPSLKVTPPTPRHENSANQRARGLKAIGRQKSVNVNPASLIDA